MSDSLPSPSANLLWQMQQGASLYRGPLSEKRRCYIVWKDGLEQKIFSSQVRVLEDRGLIVALPRSGKDQPTRYELTKAGRDRPV